MSQFVSKGSALVVGALTMALAGCAMENSGLDGVPPGETAAAESADMAWDASPDVPSEFSDADGGLDI